MKALAAQLCECTVSIASPARWMARHIQ
jgi:hypothetical protein